VAQNNEASVEEILESIKKVIARDNRDSALEARRRKTETTDQIEEQQASASNDSDPIELDEVLDLSEMEYSVHEEAEETTESPLIDERVRGAMQENFAALAMLAEPGARPQIVRSGETSLEGLTRELLRPMLADWLDKNLPGMVEKMVQAEIARIAGKRG
jgi:hypothetical protein